MIDFWGGRVGGVGRYHMALDVWVTSRCPAVNEPCVCGPFCVKNIGLGLTSSGEGWVASPPQ
jgi:hypothetical protein